MIVGTDAKNVLFRLTYQGNVNPDGFNFTINGQNVDVRFSTVYWEDATDVSLSGKKRSNIRGLNADITVDFNASLEDTDIIRLIHGLLNLKDPDYKLELSLDLSSYMEIYPKDDINMLIQYRDTVRTGGSEAVIPTLEFESAHYFDDIYTYLS
jgi:hypothetical protein